MKKKHYLILDTETATLPFSAKICKSEKQRKNVAIAKPLVYDIGWVVMERDGTITKRENYLVQETFFVPNVFNTAYYCEKRPIYMDLLAKGKIKAANWETIMQKLMEDLRTVDSIAAYNAAFDFKKAIPFTEAYIAALYGPDYNEWERKQYGQCKSIAKGEKWKGEREDFLDPSFYLRGERFPLTDLWNVACKKLINIDRYRDYCLKNQLLTASAQYFRSSAETTFQYLMRQHDFEEAHTALSDAEIEAAILAKALKKGAVPPQIDAFPFRLLGTTTDYVTEKRPKYIKTVISALETYIEENGGEWQAENGSKYWKKVLKALVKLEENL